MAEASTRESGDERSVVDWHLYILRTASGSLYTGVATDVARRLREHDAGRARGARSLRGRGPLAVVYQARIGGRALALRAERALKKLPRAAKQAIVTAAPSGEALLGRLGVPTSDAAPRAPRSTGPG